MHPKLQRAGRLETNPLGHIQGMLGVETALLLAAIEARIPRISLWQIAHHRQFGL